MNLQMRLQIRRLVYFVWKPWVYQMKYMSHKRVAFFKSACKRVCNSNWQTPTCYCCWPWGVLSTHSWLKCDWCHSWLKCDWCHSSLKCDLRVMHSYVGCGSALIRDSNATYVWCIHMWDVAQHSFVTQMRLTSFVTQMRLTCDAFICGMWLSHTWGMTDL